jgi:hypothetical protein
VSTIEVGFQKGVPLLFLVFKGGVPLSKCVIFTLFSTNISAERGWVGVPTPRTPPLDPSMYKGYKVKHILDNHERLDK